MVYLTNSSWVIAAQENFEVAIANKDVYLAKDIIADTFDAGYKETAVAMTQELRTMETYIWRY